MRYRASCALRGLTVSGLTCALAFAAPGGTTAQEDSEPNVSPDVADLIVHIESFKDGLSRQEDGAGIVVGMNDRYLFVATARHVVTLVEDPSILADSVRVEFPARLGFVPAVVDTVSADFDLGVLRIERSAATAAGFRPVLDRLGDSGALEAGSEVRPVGCPGAACWRAPSPADQVLASNRIEVLFQTDFVRGGSSGGGLFNEWDEVVGMVFRIEPPGAYAYPIDFVLERLEAWGRPITITPPSIPRRGYLASVGAIVMSPTSGGAVPDGRLPSGRLTLSIPVGGSVDLNVGMLRLAPKTVGSACPAGPTGAPDLATIVAFRDRAPCEAVVNALVAGAGYRLQAGRLVARPFGELGIGRVRGRYDIGGAYDYAELSYEPAFKANEETGFGVGFGLTLDYIVLPRTIVRLMVGQWRFQDPFENATLPAGYRPKMPTLFFGLGLRMGL